MQIDWTKSGNKPQTHHRSLTYFDRYSTREDTRRTKPTKIRGKNVRAYFTKVEFSFPTPGFYSRGKWILQILVESLWTRCARFECREIVKIHQRYTQTLDSISVGVLPPSPCLQKRCFSAKDYWNVWWHTTSGFWEFSYSQKEWFLPPDESDEYNRGRKGKIVGFCIVSSKNKII